MLKLRLSSVEKLPVASSQREALYTKRLPFCGDGLSVPLSRKMAGRPVVCEAFMTSGSEQFHTSKNRHIHAAAAMPVFA